MNARKNYSEEITSNSESTALNGISWLFGLIIFTMGIVNTFWGNDPGFGVFLLLLSFVYFLPVNAILQKKFNFSISRLRLLKIVLGMFLLWAVLGVGELFDKIHLMLHDFQN